MINSDAELFLVGEGIGKHPSFKRAQLIGCISCRWAATEGTNSGPVFYGAEATRCMGMNPGTVYPILRRLEEGGVVASELEDIDPKLAGRPKRKQYRPSDTQSGQ